MVTYTVFIPETGEKTSVSSLEAAIQYGECMLKRDFVVAIFPDHSAFKPPCVISR